MVESTEFKKLITEYRKRPARWRPGSTQIARKPLAVRKRMLGLKPTRSLLRRIKAAKLDQPVRRVRRLGTGLAVSTSYPNAWDWRNVDGKDWTTPIRNQGGCGSCVAFGTLAAFEARQKIQVFRYPTASPNLSEAHLFFCGCGNCCGTGWFFTDALEYLKKYGVPPEDCFPYVDSDTPCSDTCDDWEDRVGYNKIKSWDHTMDTDEMKEWIASDGPLVGGMAVYTDFFYYTGGIYEYVSGSLEGYHAIAVVGYDDDQECWICKNSWGTGWGENGWFRIGYGESGIDSVYGMYSMDPMDPCEGEESLKLLGYQEVFSTLREFRGRYLLRTESGREYINAVRRNPGPLWRVYSLLAFDKDLRKKTMTALAPFIQSVQTMHDPKPKVLSKADFSRAEKVIDAIINREPRIRKELTQVKQEMRKYQGKDAKQIVRMLRRESFRPPPRPVPRRLDDE